MENTIRQAILVVSFGTSFPQTRQKTIDQIEETIRTAYPRHRVYRAWTSKMILKKLKIRDNIHIDNVKEAMETMRLDGITDVTVQPTHVINGIENDRMKEDVLSYRESFEHIRFGSPLLTSEQDSLEVIETLIKEWGGFPSDEALVFMGHGTPHYANSIYAALDYTLKDSGHKNIFMGTVEAFPSIDSLLKQVSVFAPKCVHLAPFMIVAGDHAQNDLAGADEDSWKSRFEQAGFSVTCHLKGLGEYDGIRRIFLRHIEEAQ